ncbi:phosphopantothenate/pantothenate synthetase [Candidatus Nitrosotalea bavarica]|uniref:phosphopantothenate/pantothenate synthetase n=1 Tax=Candidatus Nitrosotalea bavarica TaxID=1903277 RepID=UPI000C701A54|nr:phosphopantothenate/pantothenate synthetase [Candidatus Nitrosotalea bavarica]
MLIPKTHPRAASLHIREKLVQGFRDGLVVEEGLLAHGRGEMFDYLIGEKTTKTSHKAIKAAAIALVMAKLPVISVNGNLAALCTKEIVELSKVTGAKIEINLFYASEKRKKIIAQYLKKNGAKEILGIDTKFSKSITKLDSARRIVDKCGIFSADVVLVPLEDGDRTIALKKFGKKVITFDLNPMSRTAQTADITIVDNVIRGMKILIDTCKKLSKEDLEKKPKFDNKKNLKKSILIIRKNLRKMANA